MRYNINFVVSIFHAACVCMLLSYAHHSAANSGSTSVRILQGNIPTVACTSLLQSSKLVLGGRVPVLTDTLLWGWHSDHRGTLILGLPPKTRAYNQASRD